MDPKHNITQACLIIELYQRHDNKINKVIHRISNVNHESLHHSRSNAISINIGRNHRAHEKNTILILEQY